MDHKDRYGPQFISAFIFFAFVKHLFPETCVATLCHMTVAISASKLHLSLKAQALAGTAFILIWVAVMHMKLTNILVGL